MIATTRSPLVQEDHLERDLNSALVIANEKIAAEGIEGRVENKEGKTLVANQPILLVLNRKKEKTPIGISHFAHLTENFNTTPFDENARTIDELAQSIFKAAKIHEEAKKDPKAVITAAGVPFYSTQGVQVQIDEKGVLTINGKPVIYQDSPLPAHALKGEEGIRFSTKKKNGDYETVNPIDQRKGCGIFINKTTMKVYRG